MPAETRRDTSMTTKADFPEEDWVRVVRAPFVAGMAITLADPGGPIEAAKESMASVKAATNPPSREQLLSEIALDIQAQVQQHHNPVKGCRPAGSAPAGDQILQELSDVRGIVNAHATPEEAAAFGAWLVSTAEAAAHAAKEGGFMGFKAELVSERETEMIEKVRAAVS